MIVRIVLFLIMAIGLAGFGVTAWISTRAPAPTVAEMPKIPPTQTVLAVSHDIRAGSLLATGDLKNLVIPSETVPRGAIIDTASARQDLFGSMVRRSLAADQPILGQDALRPGDHGFLAAVLGDGKLAVTVAVDAVSGSAGLIWPGDHVNLVLTQTLEDPKIPAGHRVAAETVLSDVRVIAIDQDLMQGATGTKTAQPQAGTVTLEVTSDEDEKVAVAAHLGRLSLAVLSAGGVAAAKPLRITWAKDVSPALAADQAAPVSVPPPLRIFRGPADAQEYRY
jgi:pilus assembly protein CpaB